MGGLVGPLNEMPFKPWFHTSPLMTRPKKDSDSRRVISDLTFPHDKSINAYIMKNAVWGRTRDHSLPTVKDVVSKIRQLGTGSYMPTIDIERAYKNFRSDPLDWPLLCAKWKEKFYCDVTLPFGSRASRYHMQTVARAIVDVLERKGVYARVYLDDIIIVSPDKQAAITDHLITRELLQKLGLPVAMDKLQPPARAVEWLGITIDTVNMTLSIPSKKVTETLTMVKKCRTRRSISKRELQSLIGKLIHIA